MPDPISVQFLRLPQVVRKTGLQRDSIYRLSKQGKFPKPVKLSERASGWINSEVEMWCAERTAERNVIPGAAA